MERERESLYFLCTSCAHAQCEGIIEQVRIEKCSYLGGRKRQAKEEEGRVSFFSVSIRRRRRRVSTAIPWSLFHDVRRVANHQKFLTLVSKIQGPV